MAVPVWVLLGFAGWTLVLLILTVGSYRGSRVLTGRAQIKEFHGDNLQGTDFYRRAMRAHANCVENLPVYAAIVLVMTVADAHSARLDDLAVVFLTARIVHSIVHVGFQQTNVMASLRFVFFFIQIVCMSWMGGLVAWSAA